MTNRPNSQRPNTPTASQGQGGVQSPTANSRRSSASQHSTIPMVQLGVQSAVTGSPRPSSSQQSAVPVVQPNTSRANSHGQGSIRRQSSNGSQRSSGSRKSTNSQGIRGTSSPMPGGSQQSAVPVVQPNTPGVSNGQGSIRSQRSNVSQRSSGSRKSTISQGIIYSHRNAV